MLCPPSLLLSFFLLPLLIASSFSTDPLPYPSPQRTKTIGACLTIAHYEKHLIEWIEYHSMIGISKFFLYYDYVFEDAERSLQEGLSAYIQEGTVVLESKVYLPDFRFTQPHTYEKCIKDHSEEVDWLTFHDEDEYIVCWKVIEHDPSLKNRKDCLSAALFDIPWIKKKAGLVLTEKRFSSYPFYNSSVPPPQDYIVIDQLRHFFPNPSKYAFAGVRNKVIVNTRSKYVDKCHFVNGTHYQHNCLWNSKDEIPKEDGMIWADSKSRVDAGNVGAMGFKSGKEDMENPLLWYNHYFFYTCYENMHERIHVRQENRIANLYKDKLASNIRTDPGWCEKISAQVEAQEVDDTLDIYIDELKRRVAEKKVKNALYTRFVKHTNK